MKIRKNDTVKILYGKDSGKTGKVVKVVKKDMMLIVEGLNMYKKHVKGDGKNKQSEIVTISKPLHMSKVMLVDPSDNKPTRVKYEITKDGKKGRMSVKSNKGIDVVKSNNEVKTVTEKVSKKKETKTKETTKKSKSKSK